MTAVFMKPANYTNTADAIDEVILVCVMFCMPPWIGSFKTSLVDRPSLAAFASLSHRGS